MALATPAPLRLHQGREAVGAKTGTSPSAPRLLSASQVSSTCARNCLSGPWVLLPHLQGTHPGPLLFTNVTSTSRHKMILLFTLLATFIFKSKMLSLVLMMKKAFQRITHWNSLCTIKATI